MDVNKAFATVEGKVYQGAEYGLEIPCVYQFYEYIDKLREVIDSLKTSGLVSVDIDYINKLLLFMSGFVKLVRKVRDVWEWLNCMQVREGL